MTTARLTAAFVILQMLDALTTFVAVTTHRADEANYLLSTLINNHPWLAFPVKGVVIAIVLFVWGKAQRPHWVMWFALGVTAWAVISNGFAIA